MKKLLLTALCGAAAMVASAATFTYTHTFAAGEVKAEGGAVALSGVDWTAAAATYIGFDTSDFKKGLQIGSKNKPADSWTISTSAFAGVNVTKVVLESATASGGKAEITVSVGGQSFGTNTVERDLTSLSFEGNASGDLLIDYKNVSEPKLGMYLKSITVTYEGDSQIGEGETPVDPDPVEPGVPVSSLNATFEGVSSISGLPGWSLVNVKGNKPWFFTSFDNNTYASCTGYKGTSTEGYESWIITPAIDMAKVSPKTLTFDTQAAYSGSDELNVYVMTSADPATATLTKLECHIAEPPASGYSGFESSGDIDLSSFSGTIYIGFCYSAPEGQTGYRTYCIDNVKLGTDEGGENPDPVDPSVPTVGDGTQANPYTVADLYALNNPTPATTAWVKGYIVGSAPGKSADSFTTETGANAANTNIFIAASASETDYAKCVAVQLPAGDVRTALSLQANEDILGKEVGLFGSLEKYFGMIGVKAVTEYVFEPTASVEKIEAVEENAETVIYDLSGRRVMNPVRGLYIINGKKVLVK